ncbi:MAG TPA: glycosyltransferase [Coriobacteriia bacterium]|nr:glycosyltransferase [Coriobacteriia bacterium]
MRVLYYSPVINAPSGGGTHARGLAAGFAACGHEVLTIPEIASADGVPNEAASSPSRLPDWMKAYARELRGRHRKQRDASAVLERARGFAPDVLVVRRPSYDLVADVLETKLGCPVVVETNAVYHLESSAWGERLLRAEIAREIAHFRRADVVACISDEVAADVASAAGISDTIRVCSNGVDADAFSPDGASDDATAVWAGVCDGVIGYCGGVSPLHDLATIAAAADEIARRRPQTGFLFVGADPAELEPLLSDAVRASTRITGPVPHSAVASYLHSADVCWAAFPYDYPSPLKVYEYLALARPVVIAGHGLPERIVAESEAGVSVARADAHAMADAAVGLLDDSVSAHALGARGRNWILSHATWQKVAEAMLAGVGPR